MFLSQSDVSVCQVDIFRVTVSVHHFPCVHLFLVYIANFQLFLHNKDKFIGILYNYTTAGFPLHMPVKYWIVLRKHIWVYFWVRYRISGIFALCKWWIFCYTGIFLSEIYRSIKSCILNWEQMSM